MLSRMFKRNKQDIQLLLIKILALLQDILFF
jgi:hypothetical protein